MGVPPRLQQPELKPLENLKWQQRSNQQAFTRVLQSASREAEGSYPDPTLNTINAVILARLGSCAVNDKQPPFQQVSTLMEQNKYHHIP